MKDQQTKRIIVILGAGRSGTSLLMQILHKLGMTVSEIMTPASEANPDGGYEDLEIFALQSKMLDILNTKQLFPLPDDWMSCSGLEPLKNQLKGIIQKRISDASTIFGVKDPRIALFMPLWKQIFAQLKIVPIYILAIRDPARSVRSLVKNYNHGEMVSELFWMNKYVEALINIDSNCYIVHYEDWFTQPIDNAKNLLAYTRLDQFYQGVLAESLKNVIKPNLNRAIYEEYEVQNKYVIKLYSTLRECRGDSFDRVQLMTVVKECHEAMNGFKGWYLEAQKSIRRLAQERELVDKEKRKVEEERSNTDAQRRKAEEQQRKAEEQRRMAEEQRRMVEEQRRKTEEQRRKVDEVEAQLEITKSSHAYRIGNTVVNALKRPGWKTIRLPYDLLKLTVTNQGSREILKQQGGARNTSKTDSLESVKSEINSDFSALELADAVKKRQSLSHEYELAADKIADLECKLGKSVDSETVSQEMTKAVLSANRLLIEFKDTEDAILEWRIRSQAGIVHPRKPSSSTSRSDASTLTIHKANLRSPATRTTDTWSGFKKKFKLRPPNSYRFRRQMQHAWEKPGKNTVLFPVRLIRHLLEVSNAKRKQKAAQ